MAGKANYKQFHTLAASSGLVFTAPQGSFFVQPV